MYKISYSFLFSAFLLSSIGPNLVQATGVEKHIVENIQPVRLGSIPIVELGSSDLLKSISNLNTFILRGEEKETSKAIIKQLIDSSHNKVIILSSTAIKNGLTAEEKENEITPKILEKVTTAYEKAKEKYHANAIEERVPFLENSAGISFRINEFERNAYALSQVAKKSKTPFTQGYRMNMNLDPQINLEQTLDYYKFSFKKIIDNNYNVKEKNLKLKDIYFNFVTLTKDKKEFDKARSVIEKELLKILKEKIKDFKDTDLGNLVAYTIATNVANKEIIKAELKGKVRFVTEESIDENSMGAY